MGNAHPKFTFDQTHGGQPQGDSSTMPSVTRLLNRKSLNLNSPSESPRGAERATSRPQPGEPHSGLIKRRKLTGSPSTLSTPEPAPLPSTQAERPPAAPSPSTQTLELLPSEPVTGTVVAPIPSMPTQFSLEAPVVESLQSTASPPLSPSGTPAGLTQTKIRKTQGRRLPRESSHPPDLSADTATEKILRQILEPRPDAIQPLWAVIERLDSAQPWKCSRSGGCGKPSGLLASFQALMENWQTPSSIKFSLDHPKVLQNSSTQERALIGSLGNTPLRTFTWFPLNRAGNTPEIGILILSDAPFANEQMRSLLEQLKKRWCDSAASSSKLSNQDIPLAA